MHRRLTQVFLAANSLFWLPWGLINLIWPTSWSGAQVGLAMYELPNMILAWILFLLRPR